MQIGFGLGVTQRLGGGGAGGGGGPPTTFDAAKAGQYVVVTSSGRTATNSNGGNDQMILSVSAIVGKKYFEFKPTAGSNNHVGLAQAGVNYNTYLGNFGTNGLNTCSYYAGNTGGGFNLTKGHSNWTTNDVVGLAVNTTTGTLALRINGAWQGGADPSAGTGMETYPVTGTIYAAVGLGGNVAGIANFASADFVYTPPTGYSAI